MNDKKIEQLQNYNELLLKRIIKLENELLRTQQRALNAEATLNHIEECQKRGYTN